jgi:hypothetical protein
MHTVVVRLQNLDIHMSYIHMYVGDGKLSFSGDENTDHSSGDVIFNKYI